MQQWCNVAEEQLAKREAIDEKDAYKKEVNERMSSSCVLI